MRFDFVSLNPALYGCRNVAKFDKNCFHSMDKNIFSFDKNIFSIDKNIFSFDKIFLFDKIRGGGQKTRIGTFFVAGSSNRK